MRIYLVRHGETDWNRDGILMGQTDVPLNENGKNQARKLMEKLSDVKFDVCYSSPLSRAKETAEIICQDKIRIIDDKLLKERDCGEYSGKHKHQVDWEKYNENLSIETGEELFERAREFAERISCLDVRNILIVSHSGLLKNLYHVLQGKDFETFNWDLYNDEFKNNGDFIVIDVT